jgi:hypothetical protein
MSGFLLLHATGSNIRAVCYPVCCAVAPACLRAAPSPLTLLHLVFLFSLIFCFVCSSELLIHTRIHHVYAFSIFCHAGLRVSTVYQLVPNFTCTFTAHPAVSFTCHIAPAGLDFTFTAHRVRYALSCINNLIPLPLLFLTSFHKLRMSTCTPTLA